MPATITSTAMTMAIAIPASKGKAKAKNPTTINRMAHPMGNVVPLPNADVSMVLAPCDYVGVGNDAATSISGIRWGGQPFRDNPASENAAGARYPEFDCRSTLLRG